MQEQVDKHEKGRGEGSRSSRSSRSELEKLKQEEHGKEVSGDAGRTFSSMMSFWLLLMTPMNPSLSGITFPSSASRAFVPLRANT